MKKSLVTSLLLALTLLSGAAALTGCLDPHDTHVQSASPSAR